MKNLQVGMRVKGTQNWGYWDVTQYPYGGDFKRFTEDERGTIIDGPVKQPGEHRILLDDGRIIVAGTDAIDPLTLDELANDTIGAEQFKALCQDEKTMLEITRAHSCCDKHGVHQYYKALCYPEEYRVSRKQIEAAKVQAERLKKSRLEVMKITPARLVFCGYGMERPDGMNHRIRCEIVAADRQEYFLELCYIKVTSKFSKLEKGEYWDVTHFTNHGELNRWGEEIGMGGRGTYIPYSPEAVVKWVNETLGCNFRSMGVDQYLLRTEDYKNVSPPLSE